ncbi:MAG TPA: hypothetical protein VGO31_01160 [Microbacteriaceae bacterium]|nr:hypothetical protein [Microbacteriaceae bacterium]
MTAGWQDGAAAPAAVAGQPGDAPPPAPPDSYQQAVLVGRVRRLHAAVARVELSFPATESGLSEVAERAAVVLGLLIDVPGAISKAMLANSDPFGDAETTRLVTECHIARREFARAANLEIGKRRWPWKKYGDQSEPSGQLPLA